MDKIKCRLISTETSKVQGRLYEIELHEKHISLSYKSKCKYLDDDMNIWKEGVYDVKKTILKKAVYAMDLYYSNDNNQYVISIDQYHHLQFEDEIDANVAYSKLQKWVLDV